MSITNRSGCLLQKLCLLIEASVAKYSTIDDLILAALADGDLANADLYPANLVRDPDNITAIKI